MEHGILPAVAGKDVLQAARDFWGVRVPLSRLVEAVLERSGVLCALDAESDEVPCRHDELVEHVARSSRGLFAPEELVQE